MPRPRPFAAPGRDGKPVDVLRLWNKVSVILRAEPGLVNTKSVVCPRWGGESQEEGTAAHWKTAA